MARLDRLGQARDVALAQPRKRAKSAAALAKPIGSDTPRRENQRLIQLFQYFSAPTRRQSLES
jgi:hypothetical protein